MSETVQFLCQHDGLPSDDTPDMTVSVSVSGRVLNATTVVRKFAEFLIAAGWSSSSIDELIPGWRDLA